MEGTCSDSAIRQTFSPSHSCSSFQEGTHAAGKVHAGQEGLRICTVSIRCRSSSWPRITIQPQLPTLEPLDPLILHSGESGMLAEMLQLYPGHRGGFDGIRYPLWEAFDHMSVNFHQTLLHLQLAIGCARGWGHLHNSSLFPAKDSTATLYCTRMPSLGVIDPSGTLNHTKPMSCNLCASHPLNPLKAGLYASPPRAF